MLSMMPDDYTEMIDAVSQPPVHPLQWLEPYSASRKDNRGIVDAYFRRLSTELPKGEYDSNLPADVPLALHSKPAGSKRNFFHRLLQFGRELQGNWLTALFLVSDPTRLGPWRGRNDILKSVVARREGNAPDVISDIIKQAGQIVLVSPNFTGSSQQYSDGEIMWLGPLGFAISALQKPLKLIRLLLSDFASGKARSVKSLFLRAVDAGFASLADTAVTSDLLMLTSNSHVAEQLRWRALGSAKFGRVVEIMHGIPTNELRAYHQELRVILGDARFAKALFVGLCPGTDLGSIYQMNKLFNRNYTINLKFNALDMEAVQAKIVDRIADESQGNRKYSIAINGATHYAKRYISSPAYQAELGIIGAIRETCRLQGSGVEIVYSIHPAHYKSGQATELIAAIPADRFDSDSLVSWLTCDLCVALYSSSYWDAKYVGCPALLMVDAEAGIFAEELLDAGSHIAQNQTALEALEDAVSAVCRSEPITRRKMAARLAILFK
jgi:hypothetical protein